MQQPDNQITVSASNFIAIECSNLDINCLSFDRGGVGFNVSDIETIVSASDNIDIRCSPDNFINKQLSACIWPFHGWVQHVWHHIHLIFFLRHWKSLIDSHTHLFNQVFFIKKHQSSAFPIKDYFHTVTHAILAKGLKNRDSQSASKHVFYISANDHFNVSANGHFERSFYAAKTGQISHHFFPFIVDFSISQLPFLLPSSLAIKAQQKGRWYASNRRDYE